MAGGNVSIRPSEFVVGGAVPVDRNLLWKECRFANFDYTTKAGKVVASTIAARITYVDDDGNEFIQHYSAGDPARFQPSEDEKRLVPIGTAQALAQSSNFYILMNALINSGFPENRLSEDGDISILDGLYTHNIGIPEPKRVGLARQAEEAAVEGGAVRQRVISVPDAILKLPWEKKAGAKAAAPAKGKAAPATVVEEVSDETASEAIVSVADMLKSAESVTRQQVATRAIRAKKQAVAKFVFAPEFQAALLAEGYSLDGENISKAE